jgi:uncharacterized protein with PIN domain
MAVNQMFYFPNKFIYRVNQDKIMKCHLCNQPIKEYHPSLHHLQINNEHAVDICPDCIKKFFKWQGSIYASLFPTKTMKKRFGDKK